MSDNDYSGWYFLAGWYAVVTLLLIVYSITIESSRLSLNEYNSELQKIGFTNQDSAKNLLDASDKYKQIQRDMTAYVNKYTDTSCLRNVYGRYARRTCDSRIRSQENEYKYTFKQSLSTNDLKLIQLYEKYNIKSNIGIYAFVGYIMIPLIISLCLIQPSGGGDPFFFMFLGSVLGGY
jgi:hypothetical protein